MIGLKTEYYLDSMLQFNTSSLGTIICLHIVSFKQEMYKNIYDSKKTT